MEKGGGVRNCSKKSANKNCQLILFMAPKVIFVPILQEEAVYEEPTPKFEPPPPPQPMLVPVSN